MDPIAADSPSGLLRELSAINTRVPPRTERTTEDAERATICRFLSTFADSDLFHYPLRVDPGDRPDFSLVLPKATIGVEVTEAVPTDLARADALQEHRDYDAVRFLQRFTPGEPPRSLEEVDEIARGNVSGEGWAGDSVEVEWADAMIYFSLAKAERFSRPGFRRHASNWLLIYDNWELPMLNEPKAAAFFQTKLIALDPPLPFDRIFVECERTIWQFAPPWHGSRAIVDVWGDS